jgi:hypothetical protein
MLLSKIVIGTYRLYNLGLSVKVAKHLYFNETNNDFVDAGLSREKRIIA